MTNDRRIVECRAIENKLLCIGVPSPDEKKLIEILKSPENSDCSRSAYFKLASRWIDQHLKFVSIKTLIVFPHELTLTLDEIAIHKRIELHEVLKKPNPNPFDMQVREYTQTEMRALLDQHFPPSPPPLAPHDPQRTPWWDEE